MLDLLKVDVNKNILKEQGGLLMKNMKLKTKIYIMSLAVIFLGISIFFINNLHKNDFIIDSACDSMGNMYIMSYGDNDVYIKKVDSNNKILLEKKFPRVEGSIINEFSSLIVTPEGKMMILVSQMDVSTYKTVKEQICLYSNDGKDKKVIFEDTGEEEIRSINYYDNNVYFFQDSNVIVEDKQLIDVKNIDISSISDGKIPSVKTLKTISYRGDIRICDLLYTKSNEVIFTTENSEIYKVNKENKNTKIYPIGNQKNQGITSFAYDSNDNIYFEDINMNEVVTINVNSLKTQELYNNDELKKIGIDYGTLQNVKFESKEKFYGVQSVNINMVKPNIVSIIDNNKVRRLEDLSYSTKLIFTEICSWIPIVLISIIILVTSILVIKKINKGKSTIIFKQLLILIPIITISIITIFIVSNKTLNAVVDNQLVEEIYKMTKDKIDIINKDKLKNIDWKAPQDNSYYNELLNIVQHLYNNDNKIYNYKNQNNMAITNNHMYSFIYPVKNNQIYTGICNLDYRNIPIQDVYSKADCQKYEKAVIDKQFVYAEVKYSDGEWLALISPILDNNGNVIALMEIGTAKQGFVNNMILGNAKNIAKTNIIIGIIMISSLIIGLYYLLLPLKRLKNAVTALMKGDLGVQVVVNSNDEVAEISEVFNKMSLNLKHDMDKLTRLNDAYHRFVPLRMFEILNKKDILDVNIGDQVKINISLLSLNTNNFKELSAELNTDNIFVFINNIFSMFVPVISKNNGVVERYNNSGLISLYPQSSVEAIKSAIEIRQKTRLFEDSKLNKVEIGFVINKEDLMIGIIGCEERLGASVISDYLTIVEDLNEFGKKYGSSILVTEACIDELNKSNISYNYRKLGYIRYKNKRQVVSVYDFFDGDDYEIIALKKQTKDIFQKAVEYYCNKDFYNARRVFIEVLKQFNDDKASKEYLKLCDKYYRIEDVTNIATYLELF